MQPIKLKNICVAERSDPLHAHINSFLSPSKEKRKYAEERLKAACHARDLIKKNSDSPEKVSKSIDRLKTDEDEDKPRMLSAMTPKALRVNPESQQTINEYLSNQDELRKENQLVYGKSISYPNSNHLGLGLIENLDKSAVPFYKKKLISSNVYAYCTNQNIAIKDPIEFGVTYDNIIFIVPKFKGITVNNLYKMAQGTLLKAIGSIQIGNKEVKESLAGGETYSRLLEGQINYISVYSAFFDAPIENIAVSLFALQELGIDLSATKVTIPNDNGPLIRETDPDCKIAITRGEIKDAAYYLDETHFPGAKVLAEKQLTFLDKIDELFCSIDDQVLFKQNKRFIEELYGEKELLKLNLLKLFNCTEKFTKNSEKKARVTKTESRLQNDIHQPSTSLQAIANQNIESKTQTVEDAIGSFNDYWQAIKDHIQFFKEKNIDLSFLAAEIYMILAYIWQNKFTLEEKTQLQTWCIPGTITPGRGLDRDNISSFVTFYENDPIQTCINLLRDYSKGQGISGALKRFFSLAWNRHYVRSVNQFLRAYDQKELPDNLTVDNIFNKLRDYGATISLLDNKSTLLNRLVFCAKLIGKKSDLVPVLEVDTDLAPVTEVPVQPEVLPLHSQPSTPAIYIASRSPWVLPPILTTPPPIPLGGSRADSADALINRTKIGSYPQTSKKFFDEPIRPRSSSDASKLLSTKFFIDVEKGLSPIMLLGEQGKEASAAAPSSPRVSGLKHILRT